jgi:manganese/zinc/iron transport system substrate-binding protein
VRETVNKKLIAIVALLSMLLMLMGCNAKKAEDDNSQLHVVTTISMIADIAENVGGDYVKVTGLMGPSIDPHLYKASQGDIQKLQQADLILYNGLNLEGKMADIFVKMSREKPTIAVTEYIPEESLREPPEFNGHYDPHVWFDVKMWMKAVERVRDAFIEADPTHKEDYEKNAAVYLQELEKLDQYVKEQISQIPVESRVLVTAHDAFGYFGEAYGIEVMGLQGISTDSEYGLRDVQDLVDTLVDRKVKAVFVESSVPRRSIEAVVEGAKSKGHEVMIGGQLFSDAMGEPGTEEGTYVGMVKHNVDTIVSALK